MKNVTIGCSGGCGKSVTINFKDVKKCDYYVCNDENCSTSLFEKIGKKNKKSLTSLISKHTKIDQNAAGDFVGINFYNRIKGKVEFGIYGEQKIALENEKFVFALIPRADENEKYFHLAFEDSDLDPKNFPSIGIEAFWGGGVEPDYIKEGLPGNDEITGMSIIHEDGSVEYVNLIDELPSYRSDEDILLFCETRLFQYFILRGKKEGWDYNQVFEKYFEEVGSDNNIKIENVRSGKYDFI